jgi:hypothetical protein
MSTILSILGSEKIKVYLAMAIGAMLIVIGSWVYNLYQENKALKLHAKESAQNIQALRDSVNQVRGQLVEATAFVRNLNVDNSKLKGKYVALEAKFASYIDSVSDSGSSAPVVTDTTITISFQGSKSIADYFGRTVYETKNKTSDWELEIRFRPIETMVKLFQENNLWKYSVESRTPGVTVMGTGTIDENTYERLQKYAPPEPMNRYMVGLALGQHGGPEIGYRANQWNFTVHYDMFNRYPDFYKNVYAHILWCPF